MTYEEKAKLKYPIGDSIRKESIETTIDNFRRTAYISGCTDTEKQMMDFIKWKDENTGQTMFVNKFIFKKMTYTLPELLNIYLTENK